MKSSTAGFTLLEILAAITAMSLIMAFTGASYSKFNRKTTLRQAALTLKTNLRSIGFRAINGQKPLNATCTQLDGYVVTFAASTYSYQASCTPASIDANTTTVDLPTGVTFSPVPSAIFYKILGLGTKNTGDVTITLVNVLESYAIKIKPSGEIVDLGFQ